MGGCSVTVFSSSLINLMHLRHPTHEEEDEWVGWGTWLVVTMRERLFNWSLRFLNEGLSLQDSVKLTSRYLHLYCKELKNKNIKLRSANRTQQAGATEQRLQLEGYGSIAHCLNPHKSENTYINDAYVWVHNRSNMPMFCLKKLVY